METNDDLAIYAQPLSSDEEDATTETINNGSSTPKDDTVQKAQFSSKKRPAPTRVSSRAKARKVIRDEPDQQQLVVGADQSLTESFWIPPASQKRRLNKGYANRKLAFQAPEPIPERQENVAKQPGYVSYDEVQLKKVAVPEKKGFVDVEPVLGLRPSNNTSKSKPSMKIADLPQKKPGSKAAGFQMPDLPEFVSSSTSAETDVPTVFETSFSFASGSGLQSPSTSVSSLSSARSMSPIDLDIDVPALSHKCPICRKYVQDSKRLAVPANLRSLSVQQQRSFCNEHQLCNAKDVWEERKYPTIDWQALEKTRIPRKLSFLRRIIAGQTPNLYLDELKSQLKSAKGNRKKVQAYLNEGIVDFAKPGYYGPKGTQLMVRAITVALTDSLKTALQKDSVIRGVGIGAFVSAVLVPALTLTFVIEDLNLQSEESGRKVLEESTSVGALLNPDDDHIERNEDDD
ncbi:hypothetical protein B0A52_01599 [Exophiala mesophila]|uniref:Restriction of telomere capping protein 4 n=1 Tax=Exophiala mesophila TaxID=212818 RepID=A0A438NFG8_EXOME|nr:hypothetical protein B0A52_01599 [Exophiala mesophila]